MNFNEINKFSKEFKKLLRKYQSLADDFFEFKKVIAVLPDGAGKHFNILTKTESIQIIKARFFCKYLRGSSLRIIYSYQKNKELIEFIEIYFKGDKENEDKARINGYLKNYH